MSRYLSDTDLLDALLGSIYPPTICAIINDIYDGETVDHRQYDALAERLLRQLLADMDAASACALLAVHIEEPAPVMAILAALDVPADCWPAPQQEATA